MVQQSKGGAPMAGCRFNTWPTEGERQAVARRQGVPASPTGLPDPDDPTGAFDSATVTGGNVVLTGWAVDADEAASRIVVVVDGGLAGTWPADRPRPDVATHYPAVGPNRGFHVSIPLPAGTHQVCPVVVGAGPGAWFGPLGCETVVV
jgi:hypothetical protein